MMGCYCVLGFGIIAAGGMLGSTFVETALDCCVVHGCVEIGRDTSWILSSIASDPSRPEEDDLLIRFGDHIREI